ncbi:MAG: extensin family protein [Pseudomonadota bacterium]
MRWKWVRRIVLIGVVALALATTLRHGWLPAQFSPLPALDLERPIPVIVDWQLVELANDRALCRRFVTKKGVRARLVPDRPISNGCGWRNAVGMLGAGGANVSVRRVSCGVAGGLALWIKHVVQPEAMRLFGSRVVSIGNMGVYSCRNIIGVRFFRNRRSQHATANAIDVGSFRLANGQTISILRHWNAPDNRSVFLRTVHRGACRFFRVVLGPDFNRAHRDHFHFDRGLFWRCV